MAFFARDGQPKYPKNVSFGVEQTVMFFAASPAFDRYDMMGESFDGIGGRSAIPEAVRKGQCGNSPGMQPYAGLIAATQYQATLAPGEAGNMDNGLRRVPL